MLSPRFRQSHIPSNDNKRTNFGFTGSAIFGLVACLFFIGVLAFGLNRGFDMADEGGILLYCKNPELYPLAYSIQFLLSRLPKLFQSQILDLRFYHIAASTIGTFIIWSGTVSYMRKFAPTLLCPVPYVPAILFMVCFVGNLLSFSTIERSLGYNGTAACLFYGAFGFVLIALSLKTTAARLALVTLSGALTALCVLAKFPTAVCALVFIVALLAVNNSCQPRYLLSYFLGLLLGACGMFTLIRSFDGWWHDTLLAVSLETHSGNHSISFMLATTAASLNEHKPELTVVVAVIAGVIWLAMSKRIADKERWLTNVGFIGLVGISAAVIAESIGRQYVHSSVMYIPVIGVTYLFLKLLICRPTFRQSFAAESTLRLLTVIGLLIAAPLAVSAGTNCPLLWHCLGYSGPALMGITIIATLIQCRVEKPFVVPAATCGIFAASMTQLYCGYFMWGDKQISLSSQTQPIDSLPNMAGMLVDPPLAQYLDSSSKLLAQNRFHANDYLLSLYDCPGLVWALDARSPGFAWFIESEETNLMNQYLIRTRVSQFGRPFIAIMNSQDTKLPASDILLALHDAKINFPEDYKFIGAVANPYKGYARVSFYVPKL